MGWHSHLERMHEELRREFPNRDDEIENLMADIEHKANARVYYWENHKKRARKW